MYKISKEWIDQLFHCMELFYGNKWKCLFKNENLENCSKDQWQSALYNLSYDEIKKTLVYCKWHAQDIYSKPPNSIEFYQWAKTSKKPDDREIRRNISPIARIAINEIRSKLGVRRT
jgi:hypothetical protein